ncbi:hypothetical protein KI688_007824 [Linnemannia hyalina]|uniref:Uncharacterized protein n=1 Tax=Linnemannia hyalina TaxID=64524 RepID=A0A9P7XIE9_9FUNG|nr:hypothetical protein KI688_007824 [Linnemannia hyalina]
MLNSPHQSPPLPPHKDSATYPAQVVDLTLEQQVLLVSFEGDSQLDLHLGPREPPEVKEVKEVMEAIDVKEATAQETAKDNTKPKSRAGSIGARSKDAFSAISKRFSPPPSRSQSQSNSSPSTPAPASTSQCSDTPGSTGSTDDKADWILVWLALQGSLSSPHRLGNHSPSATHSTLSFLLHILVLSFIPALINADSFLAVILRLLLPHGLLLFDLQPQAQHEQSQPQPQPLP